MSFILDALKKSESDRQRQTGPALFEVKVAPPKTRLPLWAIATAVLLAINLVIVGWLLVRRTSHSEQMAATNVAQASGSNPAPVQAGPPGNAGATTPPPNPSPGYAPPAASSPAAPMAQPSGTPAGAPQGISTPSTAAESQQPTPQQNTATRAPERDTNEPTLASSTPEANGTSGGGNADSGGNADDYAPATDPGSSLFKGHVRRGTESGLILYQDAAVAPGANLPNLRLDLHVYAAKPQDRFALINMHKLHEGDSLQDGVRVESITPDGVVMSHNGSKFLLPRD